VNPARLAEAPGQQALVDQALGSAGLDGLVNPDPLFVGWLHAYTRRRVSPAAFEFRLAAVVAAAVNGDRHRP
jgi:hypothetical protein